MTFPSDKLTARRLHEIAADLDLPDAKIHNPGPAIVRTWLWQGDWFYQWDNAPKKVRRWQGLVVIVEGKPSLHLISEIKETPEGIKGRLMPTTGKDFIIRHWMEANLPARSDAELHLKISCLKAALAGEQLVSVAQAFA